MGSEPATPVTPPRRRRLRLFALGILAILLAPPLYFICIVRSCRPPWELPEQPREPVVLTGDLRTHQDFYSKLLDNKRTLTVYLPPGYERDAPRRYPVLYMQDGQVLFDASACGQEWHVDETAERLIAEGRIEPIIIVGIQSTMARINEYTPWRSEREKRGGKGGLYARFLIEEVKPFIDKTYRTMPGREHTAVAGSSLGAFISFYIATSFPEQFSMVGVLSPAGVRWADRRWLQETDIAVLRRLRVWIDEGTGEWEPDAQQSVLAETRAFAKRCEDAGLTPGKDYIYKEFSNGKHEEAAWAARLDQVLLFFFPATERGPRP
jgi:predicted alpha/beta superfamily hydrolase